MLRTRHKKLLLTAVLAAVALPGTALPELATQSGVVVSWGNSTIPISFYDARKVIAVSAGPFHSLRLKAQLGQPIGAGNFRADANANGVINASDVSIVKSNLGTGASSAGGKDTKRRRSSG